MMAIKNLHSSKYIYLCSTDHNTDTYNVMTWKKTLSNKCYLLYGEELNGSSISHPPNSSHIPITCIWVGLEPNHSPNWWCSLSTRANNALNIINCLAPTMNYGFLIQFRKYLEGPFKGDRVEVPQHILGTFSATSYHA